MEERLRRVRVLARDWGVDIFKVEDEEGIDFSGV
jgi:hypothetical protein